MPISRYIPIVQWLPRYDRSLFSQDVVAGMTTAVMLVPQGMAYAMLAGLPPVVGLYASVVPLLVYAIFGTSRQLAVGPVAMVSLLVASGVGGLARSGTAQYLAYAVQLAFMVGVLQLGMGLARLGFLTNFLSHPVLSGFTSAAAIIIGVSQLGHFFGVKLPSSHYLHESVLALAARLDQTHLITLLIGVVSVAILFASKRIDKRFPGALVVVVLATLVVWALDLSNRGVRIVGSIPSGVPSPRFPVLDVDGFSKLWPTALTISLVGFMESIAVAKAFARRNRYEVDPNQELVGLGMANLGGALFQAYPVTGGFSRTAVNAQAGARTAVASIITALFVGLTLLFLTPLFHHLPQAVLAAIILTAVVGLIDTHEVAHLWKVKRSDLALLTITFLATLMIGIDQGILTGVGASLLWFVVRTTRPHFAVLGRLPGTRVFRNVERYPEARTVPGVLVLRVDAQFYFGNVSFLRETLRELESKCKEPLRAVVLDATSINHLDSSADSALHEILAEFKQRQIQLHVAGAKGPVLDVMRRSGLFDSIGSEYFHFEVADAVDAIHSDAAVGEPSSPAGSSAGASGITEDHGAAASTVAVGNSGMAPRRAKLAYCQVLGADTQCACPLGNTFESSRIVEESELQWESLSKLVRRTGIACIDGRHRECALGSPGGDAGELLLLLSSVEQLCGVEFDTAMVRAALVDYATVQGRFSFHSDRDSLEALLSWSDSPGGAGQADTVPVDSMERFVHASRSEREALRPLITRPEHVGCGHLRSMLMAPSEYKIRAQLVQMVIVASLEELWAHSLPIYFSVLEGPHLERAVVTFQTCQALDAGSAIPTPCGSGERGVFVHHGAVLDYLRSRVLDQLAHNSLAKLNLSSRLSELKLEMRRRACEHLAVTLDQLAPDLARYCVRFDSQQRRLEQTHRISAS